MRTWYGYDADGRLRSIESHGGGWPVDVDFNDPKANQTVLRLVNARKSSGIIGFYMHDCPCKPAQVSCSCHNQFLAHHYIDDGALRVKPANQLKIDGQVVAHQAKVLVGDVFTVQMVIDTQQDSTVDLLVSYADKPLSRAVQISGGVSEAIELPLGDFSPIRLGCWGKFIRPTAVTLFKRS
jgi:hypothetical protein